MRPPSWQPVQLRSYTSCPRLRCASSPKFAGGSSTCAATAGPGGSVAGPQRLCAGRRSAQLPAGRPALGEKKGGMYGPPFSDELIVPASALDGVGVDDTGSALSAPEAEGFRPPVA